MPPLFSENHVTWELQCPPHSFSHNFSPPVCHCYLGGSAILPGWSHILIAPQLLCREYCSNSRVLPEWLNHVYCEEIKYECPVDMREIIGGDHNVVQHSVRKLSMGQVAACIWTEIQKGKPKEMPLLALRKAGRLGVKTTLVCNTQCTKKTSGRHRTCPPKSLCADSLCTLCRTLCGRIGDPW